MNCAVHLQVYRPTPRSTHTKHGRSVYPCEAQRAAGTPECESPDASSRTKLGKPLVVQTRCDLNERPFPKSPGDPHASAISQTPPGACSGRESAGRPSATARRWPFPPDDCGPDTLLKRSPRFTCVYLKNRFISKRDKTHKNPSRRGPQRGRAGPAVPPPGKKSACSLPGSQ